MEYHYFEHYSFSLNKTMRYSIYGHTGVLIFAFPSQDGDYNNFASFGMCDCISDFIDSGKVCVVCVDGNDLESFDGPGSEHDRIMRQEAYIDYVRNQLVHDVQEFYKQCNGDYYYGRIITTGCSMGATHALIFALRCPDLFSNVIGMSGVYHASFFFPDYKDEQIYYNSPVDMFKNMSKDDPIIQTYRGLNLILSCGQGNWETDSINDLRSLQYDFDRLGIDAWCDFWGYDVDHDWPWWRKQFPYFLNIMLKQVYGY